MDLHLRWYLAAIGIFVLFNAVAFLGVIFFPREKWNIKSIGIEYTSLIFQICGVIYALFVGFIVWDVWERFYAVKQNVRTEAEYALRIFQDASVFGKPMQDELKTQLTTYLKHVSEVEWPKMEVPGVFIEGNSMVDAIQGTFYNYTPATRKQEIWYENVILKLDKLSVARLNRILNNSNSVGALRWCLLIGGGLFLLLIPCFFWTKSFFLRAFLVLFLANIISFLLFVIFSLDHPFIGYVEIGDHPIQEVLKMIK